MVFTSDVFTRLKDLAAVVVPEETHGKLLSLFDDGETFQSLFVFSGQFVGCQHFGSEINLNIGRIAMKFGTVDHCALRVKS